MVRHAPIHRRSGHSDIAICCGRNVLGSSPSTSVVPLSNQVTTLNHKRFKGFKMFSDGHSAICPYLVMVALVAAAGKLPHDAARNALALSMVAVAFLTILQSLRFGWLGSGYLCPPVVSAIYLPSSIAAAAKFGFPTVCGMVIFAGACEALVAGFVN